MMTTSALCLFVLLLVFIAWYAWFLVRACRRPGGDYHPPASASIARGIWVYSHGFLGLGSRRVYQLGERARAGYAR